MKLGPILAQLGLQMEERGRGHKGVVQNVVSKLWGVLGASLDSDGPKTARKGPKELFWIDFGCCVILL